MLDLLTSPEAWISLVTLIGLEIVLGIDNIIFIAVLCGKLPESERAKARLSGLSLAMVMRVLLLLSLFWIMKLTTPLFSALGHEFCGRDLVLVAGGLFLIAKSTLEIHSHATGENAEDSNLNSAGKAKFLPTIIEIAILDIVFSLDSVITAVGMADHIELMVAAVIIAVGVMMAASGAISRFVEANPTVKVLALAFLVLIGVSLLGDGLGFHIPKGYIYFAMAFSFSVEMINIVSRRAKKS